MPQPLSFDFCPHCGCRDIAVNGFHPEGQTRSFRCGEELSSPKLPRDAIGASYTCRSVGAMARRYEAILEFAKETARCLMLSRSAVALLAHIGGGPDLGNPKQGGNKVVADQLIRLGLISPRGPTGFHVLTPWGEIVYQIKRKDMLP